MVHIICFIVYMHASACMCLKTIHFYEKLVSAFYEERTDWQWNNKCSIFQVNGTQVTNSNHIEVVRLIKGKKSGHSEGRKTKERVENIRKLVDYVGEDNIHCTYHCSGRRRPVDCLCVYVPLSHCQQWQFPPSPLILSKCLINQCK